MQDESSTPARRKPAARSRVSNGSSLFLGEVDGRGAVARRLHDILAEIVSDLGGADTLSEAQRQLARRAATLSIQCELIEAELAAGGELSAERLDTYGVLTDRLGRCLQRIGLRRVARDITPSLREQLLREKAKA